MDVSHSSAGSQPGFRLLCFAGCLSECNASHIAQDNRPWSMGRVFHHKICISYCVGCSLHALCSLQPDNQPAKHNSVTADFTCVLNIAFCVRPLTLIDFNTKRALTHAQWPTQFSNASEISSTVLCKLVVHVQS